MSRKVVVTGGGGFVGQWIARALLNRGDEVWLAGLGRMPESPAILASNEWERLSWISCDVRREPDVISLIARSQPDLIIHLAGVSFVPTAEHAPAEAYETNVLGVVRLASIASRLISSEDAGPVLLVVGSGTQYGDHDPSEMPLTERAEQRPASVYSATKAAQEVAALQIGRSTGIRVICTRSFNHSGIGHDPAFLLPSLVGRVRALPASGGRLRIGNDVVRDYLHVDDVVAAYLALADRGVPGETYNVCSGVGVGVRQLATEVLERAGVAATVDSDSDLKRTTDTPVLIGSPAKLTGATGWGPKKTYTHIIDDLLAAS